MNVGATSETDYGDYFMWGSTTPNTNTTCDWTNAPFNNGLDSYNEEYFTTHKSEWLDDNGNLKTEFDAASHIMGGDWRMPTKNEIQELIDNTTNEQTTINGVNGMKFTSKTDTSKYIFIPASGYRSDSSFKNQGYLGFFWSSSLDTSDPSNAWLLFLHGVNVNASKGFHKGGYTVRGVL